MMDRLESMSILLTVVEAGSLSAAARQLNTPLATVSRKVSELEAHLKTRLLNRSSRQLTLTDAGRSYVAACARILEDVGEAERAARGEYSAPKGDLIITTPIVFGRLHVLAVVTEFLKAYPDIDIRMVLTDRVVNLLEDHVDLAVRIAELPDSSLIATRVGSIRLVVCGSPAYFAAHGMPKRPGELRSHACVTFEGLMSPEYLDLHDGQVQHVCRGPLETRRQHGRGRHRRRYRGTRDHPRAFIPDREWNEDRRAHDCTSRVRAGPFARQPRLYRSAVIASEGAGLPRFRGTAVESTGL
jgi:DNA-binding transcriptional LysR family regulator